MGDVQTMTDRPKERLRGRDRRSLNLSTKLTAVEARIIEDAATRTGKTPSEWAREALLKAAQGGSSNPLGMDIFIESVGSQMLMMAAFDPLLKASGMATEHINALFDRVQKTKLIRAQELSQSVQIGAPKRPDEQPNDIPRIAENSRGRGVLASACIYSPPSL